MSSLLRFALVLLSISLISVGHAATSLQQFQSIIVAEKAPVAVQAAASDLKYHLQKITGREIPLVHQKTGEGLSFYVGSGFFPKEDAIAAGLGPEGWKQVSVPSGVLLTGSNEAVSKLAGVGHAVSLFLEDTCGVRWLWPGASGEVIPKNPLLSVPALDRSGVPAFRRRELMGDYVRFWSAECREDWSVWARRTRQGNQLNANFGHAWNTVMPPAKYFEQHPEWYSQVNGKRIQAQLCTANPAMRDEFVKNLLALPANNKLDIVSVSANDGYGFCECALCRAKGDDNSAYWDFVDDIARRVKKLRPNLGIGTFAYSYSRQPPKNIERLPDNVYLSMTFYGTQLMLPEGLEEYREFIQGWKSKGVKIVLREYWGSHNKLDLPILFPREIATEIKLGAQAGMMGVYSETGKNYATQSPNYYVATHQMWNPQADATAVLNDFYSAFGPAREEVRTYFEIFGVAVKRAWQKKGLYPSYNHLVNTYDEIFDAQTLARAKSALDRAAGKAEGDPQLQERVQFIRKGYEYTALMAELLGVYEKLGRSGLPFEHFEWQATAQPARRIFSNPDFIENRAYFETRLKEPFSYTLAEQDEWLKRAWVLGQKRILLLNAARRDFSLNEGLYAQTLQSELRQWHQTVARYLGKPEGDIIELDYTRPKNKAS